VTEDSVSLAWDRSSDNWSFSYQVLMDGSVVATTADLAFRLRHLAPGSTHTFAVRARDSSGNVSPSSNSVTVTLEASSDRTPTNLQATQPPDDFCGTNVLTWDASTVVAVDRAGNSSGASSPATLTVRVDTNLC
jgi:chitodextrinase